MGRFRRTTRDSVGSDHGRDWSLAEVPCLVLAQKVRHPRHSTGLKMLDRPAELIPLPMAASGSPIQATATADILSESYKSVGW